ncbi:DNA helicase UvrD [Candidatus Desantisbacteria bacterium CG2_30_40_21]|uniref:DNA helicase UvrD n=2 Tax=unclassified Candidatus Desantisiibacteriota TaxID=3106372 RepID=A0A2M7P2U4_9BACT|nr:MAG: DNA helicase UvrD [Candidatus Desantisbacteria bacterium CG2_30_40_21]PIY19856.1 MAG: DNA helicase UvrD [Candidatus Desantisbacteria bacterium CG_4_10_14_3_um_filter_40_18]
MKIIADLHIHSCFSRATSKSLNLENIYRWAQLKGVHLVGTGDFTHPAWFAQIKDKLESTGDGLFRLKSAYCQTIDAQIPASCCEEVRFILSVEISNIYKQGNKVRKVHNLILVPELSDAINIQKVLEKIGNIRSDGRPILGLSSRNLLEIILSINPKSILIPAHIWTPWFSVLGSKSGFDSIQECFEDLSEHIFALETGLSSDPQMNWRVSSLDRFALVSNSDAHSPEKIGREATIFNIQPSYNALFHALQTHDNIEATIEFFPEEGKYHMDGHRKCQTMLDPKATIKNHGLCPVCCKPVTIGTLSRVENLADRQISEMPQGAKPYCSIIPLIEILSEIHGCGVKSKKVQKIYHDILAMIGPELQILMDTSLEDISHKHSPLLAEAISRMRQGIIHIEAGYDGEFGKVKVRL